MTKQLLSPLFGGNYVNIYAQTALQGQRQAAGLPLTARTGRCWTNSLQSRCANFL